MSTSTTMSAVVGEHTPLLTQGNESSTEERQNTSFGNGDNSSRSNTSRHIFPHRSRQSGQRLTVPCPRLVRGFSPSAATEAIDNDIVGLMNSSWRRLGRSISDGGRRQLMRNSSILQLENSDRGTNIDQPQEEDEEYPDLMQHEGNSGSINHIDLGSESLMSPPLSLSSSAPASEVLIQDGVTREICTTTSPHTTPSDVEQSTDNGDLNPLMACLVVLFALTMAIAIPILGITLFVFEMRMFYFATSSRSPEADQPCDQPLRLFARLTIAMIIYTPYHSVVKMYIFGEDRDGPDRPWIVRIFDFFFYLANILLWYEGVMWVSNCETCQTTCPRLYHSTRLVVVTQIAFLVVVSMPLMCMPFIYSWLLRHVNLDGIDWTQRRRSFDPARVMAEMERVNDIWEFEELCPEKECCICMSEMTLRGPAAFKNAAESNDEPASRQQHIPRARSVYDEDNYGALGGDVESGIGTSSSKAISGVVKTKCGHVFHRSCLAKWLESLSSASSKCPLCLVELVSSEERNRYREEHQQQ